MKVEVNKEESKGIEYPCLMTNETSQPLIILMRSPGVGTVIIGDDFWEIGAYSEDWIPERFKPFKGSITLSND